MILLQYTDTTTKRTQEQRDQHVAAEAVTTFTRKRGHAPASVAVPRSSLAKATALPAGVTLEYEVWLLPGYAAAIEE